MRWLPKRASRDLEGRSCTPAKVRLCLAVLRPAGNQSDAEIPVNVWIRQRPSIWSPETEELFFHVGYIEKESFATLKYQHSTVCACAFVSLTKTIQSMLRECENLFPCLLGVTVVLVNVPATKLDRAHINPILKVTYMASHG